MPQHECAIKRNAFDLPFVYVGLRPPYASQAALLPFERQYAQPVYIAR